MNTEPFIITVKPGQQSKRCAVIPTKLRAIQFDVILGGVFITTMTMPLGKHKHDVHTQSVVDYTYSKRPSLKYTNEVMRLYIDKL